MEYFSDKERGPKARLEEAISPTVWGGIVAVVQSRISGGAFGFQFPEACPDGCGTIGTDNQAFAAAAKAEIPQLKWPLKATKMEEGGILSPEVPYSPEALVVLDLVQFCYTHVAKPIQRDYHSYFQHHHLSFDAEAGREDFREKMNRIFSRNGLAYELKDNGDIIRLAPPGLREELQCAVFNTRDSALNQMLEEARRKFLDRDRTVRREAVERLWDAWERLKSIENPSNKKDSITRLLDRAASEPKFRDLLEKEARELTDIGNSFRIRHSEVKQTAIQKSSHFDYLFHRLLSMLLLLLKAMP